MHGGAGEQEPATAVGVGQRADHQLAERETGECAGQRQLHDRLGRGEVASDVRQRGQVGVDRQWTERDQRAQDQRDP